MPQADAPSVPSAGPVTAVRQTRHGLIRYFRNDVFIGAALETYGESDYLQGSTLARLVKPGQTALDVGANIGIHTLRLAEAVGEAGRVYAFEPQRRVFQVLCWNLAQNDVANVHAHYTAVGRRMGTVKIPTPDYARAGNFGGVSVSDGDGDIVPLTTIDSLGLQAAHLIKVDVEGMEADVLAGATNTIARHRPILFVENDRKDKSPAVIGFLLSAGYRMWWHRAPLFNPNNLAGNAVDRFGGLGSGDVLALPKECHADVRGTTEITSPDDWWGED